MFPPQPTLLTMHFFLNHFIFEDAAMPHHLKHQKLAISYKYFHIQELFSHPVWGFFFSYVIIELLNLLVKS